MNLKTLDDVETPSLRVLLRVDVNSPIDPTSGKILDTSRFSRNRETLRELEDAAVAVLAHQSRPGKDDFSTLKGHAEVLSDEIGRQVSYVQDYFGPEARRRVRGLEDGEAVLLENVRFYSEENLTDLPRKRQAKSHPVRNLAPLFDLYVNDAFACAHRNQISVTGFPGPLPAVAGRLVEREVAALDRASPAPGTLFLLGGAKMDDSLRAARNVIEKGSRVAATGLFGNLLLAADGVDLGGGSMEILGRNGLPQLLKDAKDLLEKHRDDLLLPVDVAVEGDGERVELRVGELPAERPVSDVGLETVSRFTEEIDAADAVVSNGPAGIFENELFSIGTEELLRAMADSTAFTVLGGGHLVAALRRTGLEDSIGHVSSGGGALLAYVAGDGLPGLRPLRGK